MSTMPTHALFLGGWTPPLLNQYVGRRWPVGARIKKAVAEILRAEALNQGVPQATGKRRLRVGVSGWARGGRLPDPDSIQKALWDGLVQAGLLVDDSARWLEAAPVQFVRGPRWTHITLEDVQEETTP